MKAGALRHALDIRRKTRVDDLQGGAQAPVFASIGSTFGSVESLSSRERFEAGVVFPSASHVVETRYRSDIRADDVLVLGTRAFAVLGLVNENERNIKLRIFCEEQPGVAS